MPEAEELAHSHNRELRSRETELQQTLDALERAIAQEQDPHRQAVLRERRAEEEAALADVRRELGHRRGSQQ